MPDPLSTSDLEAVRAAVVVLQDQLDHCWTWNAVVERACHNESIATLVATVLSHADALLEMAEVAAEHAGESGIRCSCR